MQVYEKGESFYVRLDMLDTIEVRYHISELEFEGFETEGKFTETCLNGIKQGIDYTFDYWIRLEHQYAGMAMQGILGNPAFPKHSQEGYYKKNVVNNAYEYAHALVEKMKEERK